MKRSAKTAFPEKYAAAVARKRAASSLSQAQSQEVSRVVKREISKRMWFWLLLVGESPGSPENYRGRYPRPLPGDLKDAVW